MPYCDGSTFGGDNDVNDPGFPFGKTRYHRGLRNVSAGMDVAREMFPDAKQITVYNDAGPIAVNLGTSPAAGGPDLPWLSVWARQNDWQFQQFYPQSCIDDGRSTAN
jgi:hypothetical protein